MAVQVCSWKGKKAGMQHGGPVEWQRGVRQGPPVSRPCCRGLCAMRATSKSLQACSSPDLRGPCSSTLNLTCAAPAPGRSWRLEVDRARCCATEAAEVCPSWACWLDRAAVCGAACCAQVACAAQVQRACATPVQRPNAELQPRYGQAQGAVGCGIAEQLTRDIAEYVSVAQTKSAGATLQKRPFLAAALAGALPSQAAHAGSSCRHTRREARGVLRFARQAVDVPRLRFLVTAPARCLGKPTPALPSLPPCRLAGSAWSRWLRACLI